MANKFLLLTQQLPPSRPIPFNGMFMNTTLDQQKNGGTYHTLPLWDAPAGNHGTYIHQNKYPIQDDEQNYRDSPRAHLIEKIGHC